MCSLSIGSGSVIRPAAKLKVRLRSSQGFSRKVASMVISLVALLLVIELSVVLTMLLYEFSLSLSLHLNCAYFSKGMTVKSCNDQLCTYNCTGVTDSNACFALGLGSSIKFECLSIGVQLNPSWSLLFLLLFYVPLLLFSNL